MSRIDVLIEVVKATGEAFDRASKASQCETESTHQGESLLSALAGFGLEITGSIAPSPLFAPLTKSGIPQKIFKALSKFHSTSENKDMQSESTVVACQVDRSKVEELQTKHKDEIRVWPNSPLTLLGREEGGRCGCSAGSGSAWGQVGHNDVASQQSTGIPGVVNPHGLPGVINPHGIPGVVNPHGIPGVVNPHGLPGVLGPHVMHGGFSPIDLANSASTQPDCRPFQPGVTVDVIRSLLGVSRIWWEGFYGQNIVVGIIDEGVNGNTYPVAGGFSRPNAPKPGSAPITSHGSMCAADILVAAPLAKLYDYPFLGIPNSGGALGMFQAVLDQRRKDGTPHLTNNSYGFVGVPSKASFPNHEVHDPNHPVHRKVREVVASGAPAFFAAGNCGKPCPSGVCHSSGIGSGKSIHASNSLDEVITVAAVNSQHQRIGYSSQGPGMFAKQKPDVASYSHFFGNFGPGRPGGTAQPFDNGTSAATPVAAGVGALLLSAFGDLQPSQLKEALRRTATNLHAPGWDQDTGHGVVNAAAAYDLLNRLSWTADGFTDLDNAGT